MSAAPSPSAGPRKRPQAGGARAPHGACGKPPRGSQRLGARERLRKPAEFRDAFNQGRPTVGRYLVLWQRRRRDAERRLGVIASKRTLRKAVDRNRAKRLLREAYRRNRHRFRGNRDVVLIARKPLAHASLAVVEDELLRLARKGGCFAE